MNSIQKLILAGIPGFFSVVCPAQHTGVGHLPGAFGVTFTAFDPASSAPVLSTWILVDSRDDKQYAVRKMPDGRYWMIQDLQFGDCDIDTFENDYSVSTVLSKPTVAPGYVGHCRINTQVSAGYLYNWPAAMNNANAYYGSSKGGFQCKGTRESANKCRGICPVGWHLPTQDEFSDAGIHFQSQGCRRASCWNASSQWKGALGGVCTESSMLMGQGRHAFYWSSTDYEPDVAYALHFSAENILSKAFTHYKFYGLSVRCVRNYQ
jgi:uncharacterized protein (TIGR02145 family)